MAELAEGRIERVFVFVTKKGKNCTYMQLEPECTNDGRPAEGILRSFDVKLGRGHAGAMYLVTLSNEEQTIHYNKKGQLPVGHWQNRADVIRWQARQRVDEDQDAIVKNVLEDRLKDQLKPLKEAYQRCHNSHEQTLLLARIMAYVTNRG